MGVAAAIIGAGAIGAAGNIFSSVMGSGGASKQASALRYQADKAQETAYEIDRRQRADLQPFMNLGQEAGTQISDILSGRANLDSVLGQSSLFKWQQSEGERGLNRQLSARGLFGSGAGLESLARFNSQLVGEEGMRYWDRLFNTTTLGANAAARAATNTSQIGASALQTQAQLGSAAAAASGQATAALGGIGPGIAGPVAGGINSYINYGLYKPLIDRYSGGGFSREPLGQTNDDYAVASGS